MQLSNRVASAIITEINKIIPYKINIMNSEGTIIASSDPKRVGKKHMGACHLIEHHLPELRIFEEDEYEGGKPGINFPIMVQNHLIGVLGIRGAYEEIRPFAQIIKRMSEIMLMNELYKEEQMHETYRKHSFLYEWIHTKETNYNHELYERGLLLGIDIYQNRRFLLVQPSQNISQSQFQQLQHRIENIIFADRLAFILPMASSFLIGLSNQTDCDIIDFVKRIEHNVNIDLRTGVDQIGENNAYLQYHQAKRTLYSTAYKEAGICFYKDILFDLFIDEIKDELQNEFIYKIFKNYDLEELHQTIEILECYYRHNGSIQKASTELYLHKNTLQNRLIKIKERTGYDPRSLSDIPLFYVAIQFLHYQDMRD